MSYAMSHTVGTTVAGETKLLIEPKFSQNPKRGGVALCHGAGSDALYCLSGYALQSTLTQRMADAGYTITSDNNAGITSWGSPASLSALTANVDHLRSSTGAKVGGKIALIGTSMGGAVALNYARAHPEQISCMVLYIPVINLTDIHSNNRGNAAHEINTAFSGSYSEAVYGAEYNPYTYRNDAGLANIPMLITHGLADTICLPEWVEAFAAASPTYRTLLTSTSGHDAPSYTVLDHNVVIDFLNTHNG